MSSQSFSTASEPVDFHGALVQLTRPKQMFVEHVDYPNHAAVHIRMMPDVEPALNSFTIAPRLSPDQDISVTISAEYVGTLFVWTSKTHATPPPASQVIASGVALLGSTTNYTFTGLDRATYYYGWVVATRGSMESDVMPNTPAQITMIPVPINSSNFAISESDMPYIGPNSGETPYSGIQNVPPFLVGVPYTRNIDDAAYLCAFDRGDIHAYGFRLSTWALSLAKPGT